MRIDKKNRKILFELDTNCRQSYHAIARKVGLSKDAVAYRISALERDGIIQDYTTVIDVGKLGYTSFRLHLKFRNTTPKKEHEIIEYLMAIPELGWMVSVDGQFDLNMWFLVKTISEMNIIWQKLLMTHGNYIERRWLTIFTNVKYFSLAFLVSEHNTREQMFITEPSEPQVDKKDLDILHTIAGHSRKQVVQIAREVGLSTRSVIDRIKLMEKRGVIIGYRARLDVSKLGYLYYKVHYNLHNQTPERIRSLRQYINEHPNIVYDNQVLGGDDIEIELYAESVSHFRNMLDDIRKEYHDIIRDSYHMYYYKEHKLLFMPDAPETILNPK